MRSKLLMAIVAFSMQAMGGMFGQEMGDSLSLSSSPWPAIRIHRIRELLPGAMERTGVDAWVIVCRENNNDPLALHIGGENAGGSAAFLFFRRGSGVDAVAISPSGEATALREQRIHDTVIIVPSGRTVWEVLAAELRRRSPSVIAINASPRPITDGISWTQRQELEHAIGPKLSKRLVSSDELVTEWLSVKLPAEIEIMRKAAALTEQMEIEAYGTIVPGVTRDSDVAAYLKRRMRELGVDDAWTADQNPNVNSGPDRGHSNATDRIIQAGDFIQTDFGIKVFGIWCTDIQRFAYVLPSGQSKPGPDVLEKWERGKRGSRTALAAMKPGVRGYDVDKAQRFWMKSCASLPVPWGTGHPVGYWAHDLGPALTGAQSATPPSSGPALRVLKSGQTFAFDGFFCWSLDALSGTTKTISVEEMAVVTEKGAEYLIPPQDTLVLVPWK